MSKCLRYYYNTSKNTITTELCYFTKSNYKDKFKEYLNGDYEGYNISDKLANRHIAVYINAVHTDFKQWINYDHPRIWQIIEEDTNLFAPMYIKGDMLFCKLTNRGLPTDLSKEDIKYIESFIKSYTTKINMKEKEYNKEVDRSNVIMSKEELIANLIKYYDIMYDFITTCYHKCDHLARPILFNDPDRLESINTLLQQESNISISHKLIKEDIEYSLNHKDNLHTYLRTYLECATFFEDIFTINKQTEERIYQILDIYAKGEEALDYLKTGYFVEAYYSCNDLVKELELSLPQLDHTPEEIEDMLELYTLIEKENFNG